MSKILSEKEISKALCFLLRHEKNIERDKFGYVKIEDVLKYFLEKNKWSIIQADIEEIVLNDEKIRYSILDDTLIRCNYGHSVPIEVDRKASSTEIPNKLYHGTKSKILIEKSGAILPMNRQYVHLSISQTIAIENGSRFNSFRSSHELYLALVDAKRMYLNGFDFYNHGKIWVTNKVPVEYITWQLVSKYNFKTKKWENI